MRIGEFFALANAHPWAYAVIVLNLAVTFINGWTDCPNAIATLVMTRSMKPHSAILMSAVFNLLGVLTIGLVGTYLSEMASVSQTIANLVSFGDLSDEAALTDALIAVAAGLLAIVAWSLGSTYFGFPSSESNELVGGITGAGMALAALGGKNWFSAINWSSWGKVLYGFFGSLLLGFLLGFLITKLIEFVCRRMNRGKTTRFFDRAQRFSAAGMSYVHGLQDGAKFIGVFILLTAMLGANSSVQGNPGDSWWGFVSIAVVMTAGTLMGGYKIIKTLGSGMAKLEKYQAFATDLASIVGLLLATFFAIPVSTGTVKSTAILGGGATRSLKQVKWKVAAEMIGSWIAIFPLTALIGFLVTLLLASIF